jgi:hypothetical protein
MSVVVSRLPARWALQTALWILLVSFQRLEKAKREASANTLTESGETMRAAGLKAISTVLETTAILIRSKKPTNSELVNLIATRIRGVISKSCAHLLFL